VKTPRIAFREVFLPITALLLLFLTKPALAQEVVGKRSDSCIACHEKMGGKYLKLVQDFKKSTHWDKGLGCVDCHGGDPTSGDVAVAMDPAIGFVGKPTGGQILDTCTKCHANPEYMKQFGNMRTDQLELYKTSIHGKRFFENGDMNVAFCSDCHSPHLIAPASNPQSSTHHENIPATCGKCHADKSLMSAYGIDADIVSDYMAGRHGELLFKEKETAAPVCTSCHGYHGAAPPGVDSVVNVCGSCHLRTEQYYAQGPHNEAFKAMSFPRCITCHDNHKLKKPTDEFITSTEKGGCLSCHDTKSAAYATINTIKTSLAGLNELHEECLTLVEETEKTTHLSMTDMLPKVEEITTKLLTARGLQHSVDGKLISDNHKEAESIYMEIKSFTTKLISRGRQAKRTVLILGALVFAYGLLMLYYTKVVLGNR
jgi:hypothetical protein